MERVGQEIYVLFSLDREHYGLPIEVVERVVRAVKVTPLPTPLPHISGMINVEGMLYPLLNLRSLFQKTSRDLELSDQFLLLQEKTSLALWIDQVWGMKEIDPSQKIPAEKLFATKLPLVASALKVDGNIVFLLDPTRLAKEIQAVFSEKKAA